jgi:hypothetical protein
MPVTPTTNYLGCDVNQLLKASACLQWCVSEEDRLALELYVRCAELAVDSDDYTALGTAKLLSDAKAWIGNGTLNPTNRQAIALYIDVLNAVNEGANMSLTTPRFPAQAMQFRSLDSATKRNLLLYLKCRLNSIDEPG